MQLYIYIYIYPTCGLHLEAENHRIDIITPVISANQLPFGIVTGTGNQMDIVKVAKAL